MFAYIQDFTLLFQEMFKTIKKDGLIIFTHRCDYVDGNYHKFKISLFTQNVTKYSDQAASGQCQNLATMLKLLIFKL